MKASPVSLIGGFYQDDSLPWAAQDTVNWLPVMAQDATLTPARFATPPGLKPYQNIGTGPIRGMHDLEGGRFIVSGRYLFRISTTGVGVPIGVIPGTGRVQMSHNQFQTGNQLLVENGEGGGGYVYSTSDGSFQKITDEGYPGSISSDYLDSFLLGVEPLGRFWFHSDLSNALSYNTLDRYEAEASTDRIVGLSVLQFDVVVFGQRTIEFFYNTGSATGTFQNRRQKIDRGCAGRHTIAKLGATVVFLGDDGIVYRINGYSAVPISTGPMARAFAGKNWAEAFAYVWEDRGFRVYYLTFPDGHTWGYDEMSGLWTRRESYGLERWRLTHTVKWGNQWYGGDFQNGNLWELNWDYYLEGDQEFVSERVSAPMSDNQSNVGIPYAELIFDTGQGPMTEAIPFPNQPPFPQITGDAPDVVIGDNYPGYSYSLSSGTAPYVVTLVSGALPSPLAINSSGVISTGVITTIGGSAFTLRVTDSNGLWTELADTIFATSAVLSLGNFGVSGKAISRRSVTGTWVQTNNGLAPTNSIYLIGLQSGRFMAWGATRTWYSDNVGNSWMETTGPITGAGGDYTGDTIDSRVVLGGGTTGNIFTSANNGTTFTTRAVGSTFASSGALFVKSGAQRGRIVAMTQDATNLCRISDNDGVAFTATVATTVDRTSGGSLMSTLTNQYVGGTNPATSKPKVVSLLNGSSIAATLILTTAANGYVSALGAMPIPGGQRILMGTNTGAIYYSDDNLATFNQATFSITGRVTSIKFNGKQVIVGCSNNATSSTFSSMNGLTYVAETNTNVHSILALGVNI